MPEERLAEAYLGDSLSVGADEIGIFEGQVVAEPKRLLVHRDDELVRSRHLRCPACRAKNICACGKPKQAKSDTCASCRSEAGDANSNWKGGRTRHKAGYVMIRIPGHPSAGRSPYVFEHIFVVEQVLGRYLVDGESVHHINGIRDDNRPENLQLWTRPQPSGIRVSDAIEWARSIYDRYVANGAPPTVLTLAPEHPWR